MILVFGGTTEGRKAAEVLEEAGSAYFYSTKTGEQDITLHHGQRIDGALDAEAMRCFCTEHKIRLIVDAAHPFAQQLHQTIIQVSETLNIPIIRYERIYPPRDADITWIDDYSQVPTDLHTLLATTGVQSISKLKFLEEKSIKVIYRILNRESSIQMARKQGATADQLCFYEDARDIPVKADAILLKESGLTGGFPEKVKAAKEKGMRIVALKRPEGFTAKGSRLRVNGPHGLRRAVERLLPEFFPLHSGLTTGTCATAAAVAAALQLIRNSEAETDSSLPKEVPVLLPNGETIHVAVGYGKDYAYCIKEAGDDPDVTDGIEVRASLIPSPTNRGEDSNGGKRSIIIEGGEGVGRFTLPGFDYPPGEPAINKGPREMIRNNIMAIMAQASRSFGDGLEVRLSVPNGEEIAKRTFNPRLGIEGGISIIGVSGIVMPYSEEAFIESIRKCCTVAFASGTDRIVINSGAKSENVLREYYPNLPAQAFVQYGNYIGETLRIISQLPTLNPQLSTLNSQLSTLDITLGVMLGKAVKLAAGQLDTHSRKTTMDLDFIRDMLQEAGIALDVSHLTLAKELWEMIPREQTEDFCHVVISHCMKHCLPLLTKGQLTILLIDDGGTIHSL